MEQACCPRFASYQRRELVARLKRGREAKAAQEGYAGGRPPFGYEAAGKDLVPYAPEAKVVVLIFDAIANQGWTLGRLARELNTADAGGRWTKNRLHRILHREVYKSKTHGIVHPRTWNKAQTVLMERRRGEQAAA